MRWTPLTLDFLLAKHGLKDSKVQLLLGIWIVFIILSLGSVFAIGYPFTNINVFGDEPVVTNYILVQVPVFIGILMVFWLGFEWGFIPVFLSMFMMAFTSLMVSHWALLFAFSFVFGLAIYALVYYCVPVDISLQSLKSFAFFTVISIVASLASSLGAFVWSEFFNLSPQNTMYIWRGWWTGMFLETMLFIAPLLYFFTPAIERLKKRYFEAPPVPIVSTGWIYSAVASVSIVLILFILSAKTLVTQGLTQKAGVLTAEMIANMESANESFEMVVWISISLVVACSVGGIYLMGRWNRNLKETVSEQTQKLKKNENMLKEALSDRDHLLDEIHDRVRNNLTLVLALLELQLKVKEDKPVEEILKDSHSRIRSMAVIHETMAHTESIRHVNLKSYAIKLSNKLRHSFKRDDQNIDVTISADDVILDIDRAFAFAMILNELMMNSYTHAFKGLDKGTIFIEIKKSAGMVEMKFRDNGIGLPEDFDSKEQATLGLRLIRIMAKQLKASFEIVSFDKTRFSLIFSQ
ncbi:MAG: histidine kinase dimerization/phosphoacceptor domain -containing protein [Balneolaceae bacterium]|nr:histidine kinase dimerization/phosphoacceptor domain -containing protein [Balneolaceae bacterium]